MFGTGEDSTLRSLGESASIFFALFHDKAEDHWDYHLRFERELEALRKELAETAASRSGASTPPASQGSPVMHTRSHSEDEISLSAVGSPIIVAQELAPTVTPINALDLGFSESESSSEEHLHVQETKKQQ